MLPPKRDNWIKGNIQMGIFIRTREGSVIELVNDNLDIPGARKEISELLAPFLKNGASDETPAEPG